MQVSEECLSRYGTWQEEEDTDVSKEEDHYKV